MKISKKYLMECLRDMSIKEIDFWTKELEENPNDFEE